MRFTLAALRSSRPTASAAGGSTSLWKRPSFCFFCLFVLLLTAQQSAWNFGLFENTKRHTRLTGRDYRGYRAKMKAKRAKKAADLSAEVAAATLAPTTAAVPENRTVSLADLSPWVSPTTTTSSLSAEEIEESAALRRPLLDLLERAHMELDPEIIPALPTWQQVTDLYGEKPVIVGLDTCKQFRSAVPAEQRYVGVAGQMNTGTNALSKYFRNNLRMPENKKKSGVLWTVPWGKHSWTSLRGEYKYKAPNEHELVMPIVLVRDPYFWMRSMCESPYTMEWNMSADHCPNLVEDERLFNYQASSDEETGKVDTGGWPADLGVPVNILWGFGHFREWPSLAHVWSSWYREYYEADFPRLIIRFEDMLFHTEEIMDQIRECVGAEWKNDEFFYATAAAKTHPYFQKFKAQSGLLSAMIRFGQDDGRRTTNMTQEDISYAHQHVDPALLQVFGYKDPLGPDEW